jgi:beta-lactam-binding protein with PASTA domain
VNVVLNWTGRSAPPCVVYGPKQQTLRASRRNLRESGCRLGEVRRRYSRRTRTGRIIAQHPQFGAVLRSHGKVNVVVTRGPRR